MGIQRSKYIYWEITYSGLMIQPFPYVIVTVAVATTLLNEVVVAQEAGPERCLQRQRTETVNPFPILWLLW